MEKLDSIAHCITYITETKTVKSELQKSKMEAKDHSL